ncbi:octaprenyl diphosphate synthase [Pleionea sediminis]|uniref:octaprenyl diphosphate synthase n=1 Tax=Pleionea sediminis TaxID=2569479 RepID=UPI0011863B7C|nr:octaprenyl diphosphate synthase [Pleionea sediminis]
MSNNTPTFESIKALLKDDINATNLLIMNELESDVALINQLGFYIVNSGGKRLRPLLVLLASRALGYSGKSHHILAAIIEFIHTATLLHDDVVDASDLRRGKETANALFGNEASVLTGDFLYSRAFQMMVRVDSMSVMNLLADTTNLIAEGEVLQLMNCNKPDITEDDYYEVIRRKTAILFAAACELAAIASGNDSARSAMHNYGLNLGMAFQVIDDMLDYVSSASEMGKNVGDDLTEGKPTLPVMYAMKHGTPEQAKAIRHAIEQGDASQLPVILEAIEHTGAIEYCQKQAEYFSQCAIDNLTSLSDSAYKQAMINLTHLALARKH